MLSLKLTCLKFLYQKNKLLSPQLRQLLCNALIQPHFDYACSVWYPNFNKKFKTKLQTLQNKCGHFCLQLDNKTHIRITEFKQINWLPANYSFRQCLATNDFKSFDAKCPLFIYLFILCLLLTALQLNIYTHKKKKTSSSQGKTTCDTN